MAMVSSDDAGTVAAAEVAAAEPTAADRAGLFGISTLPLWQCFMEIMFHRSSCFCSLLDSLL